MSLGKAGAKAAAPKKTVATSAFNLFSASMDAEDEMEETRTKQGYHPRVPLNTFQSKTVDEELKKIQEEDPTAFQFDELLEDEDEKIREAKKKIQVEGLEQKKRVGLFVPDGGPQVNQQSRYIGNLEKAKEFRDMEKEIIEQRVINRDRKKDITKHGEKDAFVTSAYKKRLEERDEFLRGQRAKEIRDEERDATKMEHGLGFAALHRTLLDTVDKPRIKKGDDDQTASASSPTKREIKEEIKKETESSSRRSSHNTVPATRKRSRSRSHSRRPPTTEEKKVTEMAKKERSRSRSRSLAAQARAARVAANKEEALEKEKERQRTLEEQKKKDQEKREREDQAKLARESRASSAKERYLARKKQQD